MERQKFDELLERMQKLKVSKDFDLSMEEDLSIGIMNLVSLEEHFFFTGSKTGKDEYFDLLDETRQIRKELLARLVSRHEGETWCITKHLLAATMRLIEVGTKFQSQGKTADAKELFNKAYRVYSLFWAVRLKLIKLSDVKKIHDEALDVHDAKQKGRPWTYEDIVNKLVDCCKE